MIDKDKVRELVKAVDGRSLNGMEQSITKWLEQNQPEPVVVGLSDEQVWDLANELEGEVDSRDNYQIVVKNYLKTQTFVHPDKLLERQFNLSMKELEQLKSQQVKPNNPATVNTQLVDSLVDCLFFVECHSNRWDGINGKHPHEVVENARLAINNANANNIQQNSNKPSWDDAPDWANWLAQDSDGRWAWYKEQPTIALGYFATEHKFQRIVLNIQNWKQTLEQRPIETVIPVTEQKQKVSGFEATNWVEIKPLPIEQRQLVIDWDNAPKDAVVCQVVKHFLTENHNEVGTEILKIEFRPAPKVEVGQVWRYKSEGKSGDDYEVTEINTLEGKLKIGDEWQEKTVIITYESTDCDIYHRTLSDFLAKFERVSQ